MLNKGSERIPENYLFKEVGEETRKLAGRLEQEGKPNDIIKIGIGDPDIPTPFLILETMIWEIINRQTVLAGREANPQFRGHKGYPDYDGIPQLRRAISDYYSERFGVKVNWEDIIIGDGAKSDLSHMAVAFANPGDKTALQDPAYPVYLNWSKFFGLDVHMIPCTKENNFFGEIPKQALDDKLALIWLCNPNNPTGAVASKEYLEKIVQQAKETRAVIVHDIAYTDFRPGGKPYAQSIFSIPGAEEVAVEIGSFSKPFSMTADRLSWVAIQNPKLLNAWKTIRTNFDSGVPEYIQQAGVTALTHPLVKESVEANMQIYGQRAEILKRGFESVGCAVFGLDHSPYCWVRIPQGCNSKEFSLRILNEAHVVTIWGSGFGKCGEGYIRTTVFQTKEKLEEAMERIKKIKF